MKRSCLYTRQCVLIFCAIIFTQFVKAQNIYLVDASHPGITTSTPVMVVNATAWNNATGYLQAALMAASGTGGQVWVKMGTYKPTAYPDNCGNCTNDRDKAFLLNNNVALYGGFAGTETMLMQRNVAANPTILSGDIGVVGNASDNSYHIVISISNNNTAILDGFTITSANANGYGSIYVNGKTILQANGGGMYNESSAPSVANCTFTINASSSAGAGMLIAAGSSPVINACDFTGNNSASDGGGIANYSSTATVSNSRFLSNIAGGNGGGIGSLNSTLTVNKSSFIMNSAYGGGGISNGNTTVSITNTAFSANFANVGGSISNSFCVGVAITNDVFASNQATLGGAIYNQNGSQNIANSTFYTTASSTNNGRNLYCTYSTTTIANSILYTSTGSDAGISNQNDTRTNISYSIVKGGYPGMNNQSADPLFVNPANPAGADGIFGTSDDGLIQQAGSPAINTGNNAAVPAGTTTDIIGNARIQGGTVDLGAYEYVAPIVNTCATLNKLYVDSSKAVSGDGSSWAMAFKELREALAFTATCNNIDTILVAKGTYKPTAMANRDTSFVIPRGKLKIYGGYPSGGGMRNLTTNPTLLSGDIGTLNDTTDNSYHVMIIANINSVDSLVVDGFTLTKGIANGSGLKSYNSVSIGRNAGGGILLQVDSATGNKISLRNLTIISNYAITFGGGIYCQASSPVLTNCSFIQNNAYTAAAMFNYSQSNVKVTDCAFTQNKSSQDAGAVLNWLNSTPVFTNCSFTGNTATFGGAMYNFQTTQPQIINCTFANNSSRQFGGAVINNETTTPTFTKCIFTGNTSDMGGAMLNYTGAAATVNACTFSGNSSNNAGGAIKLLKNATIQLVNCVFAGNSTAGFGGALATEMSSTATVTNTTFYGNFVTMNNALGGATYNAAGCTTNIINSIFYANSYNGSTGGANSTLAGADIKNDGTLNLQYSLTQTPQSCMAGCLASGTNPLFSNASNPAGADGMFGTADDGLKQTSGSPVINAGNNVAVLQGTPTDITGASRIQNGVVDLGAYEGGSMMAAKTGEAIVAAYLSLKALPEEDGAVAIYPIPAKDAVSIKNIDMKMMGKNLQLMDMQGRILQVIRITQSTQRIAISSLATGNYFVKMPDNTILKVVKD